MKLPHHLLRTYRKYKEAEQGLLIWIESAAAKSGHHIQNNDKKHQGQTGPRRGKATSKAKQKHKSTPTTTSEETKISILDIIPPIVAIAADPSTASIPAQVAEQFVTVPNLRESCVKWFNINTNQHDVETRKKNEKHAFPLKIIREAMDLLKIPARETKSRKQTTSGEALSCASTTSANVFEHLSLGERSEPSSSATHEVGGRDVKVPSISSNSGLTEEEQMQDEFNIAKFCMLRDVQEIEDFFVLELVRYSLDQANADILPYLSNLAIDVVAKIEGLLHENFDREKYEIGFVTTVLCPNLEIMFSSPILRMENLVAQRAGRTEQDPHLREYECYTNTFDSGYPYFGATDQEKMVIEQSFVDQILRLHSNMSVPEKVITLDLTPKLIKDLLPQLLNEENLCPIPTAAIFGIRIALLAALLSSQQLELPLSRLSHSGARVAKLTSSREDFWSTPRYQGERVQSMWHFMQSLEESRRAFSVLLPVCIRESVPLLSTYPLTCELNNSYIRMHYAAESIQAMEFSNIVKVLAHLWNLLQEEGHLQFAWPDMQHLLEVLGEKYMFQNERPTARLYGVTGLRSCIIYAMGLKKSIGSKTSGKLDAFVRDEFAAYFKPKYSSSSIPLLSLLTSREGGFVHGMHRAVDAELIVAATVIPDILGQSPQPVVFTQEDQIDNRDTLWKLRDQQPNLQPIDLLALAKKQISKEVKAVDFDYLQLEKVTIELVEVMAEELNVLQGVPAAIVATTDPWQKLMLIMHRLVIFGTDWPALPKIAKIFGRWLDTNGYVGVKGLNIAEQGPINPRSLLTSLRPDVLEHVMGIVKRRGLRENIFFSGSAQWECDRDHGENRGYDSDNIGRA